MKAQTTKRVKVTKHVTRGKGGKRITYIKRVTYVTKPRRAQPGGPPHPAPTYRHDPDRVGKLLLGVEAFARHTSDEGWQLQEGLRLLGYQLWGHDYAGRSHVDVPTIMAQAEIDRPGVVIVQDKREWDPHSGGCFAPGAQFARYHCLAGCEDVFRVTICKDSQWDPSYYRHFASEIGCHAWIVYYHPAIVCRLAPYLRREHVIRTWHSLDPAMVPAYNPHDRRTCLLSGNIRQVYPLRQRLWYNAKRIGTDLLKHPGYGANGTYTPDFLRTLSHYKVAICTASVFGYALRKLIEATAAGCVVITDLPTFDPLPEIDGNLIRVPRDISLSEITGLIQDAATKYDPERQQHYAEKAIAFYDYRRRAAELAAAIEQLRVCYRSERSQVMDAPFPVHMMPAIEQFFVDDANRPAGQDIYDDVFANEGFFPLQRKRELARMMQTARGLSPRIVLEIGADKGGGFYHWVKGIPTIEKAVAIEIRGTPYADVFKKAFPDTEFLFRGAPSLDPNCLADVAVFVGQGNLDVLFIDGDKTAFYEDFDAYYPLMRRGGVVFMHDIRDPGPSQAFAQARKDRRVIRSEVILDTSESDEAVAREEKGIPPSDSHEGWLRVWRGASCGVGVLYV